ncbi:MAG: acyl-CoA dehydrogenase family protein [Herbaspirillum sp.]
MSQMKQFDPRVSLLDTVDEQIEIDLLPLVPQVDQQSFYPVDYLRVLGTVGGFSATVPNEFGGLAQDLSLQIEVTQRVARACGTTAFLVWCQSSCAWYFQHTPNAAIRERYLTQVASGKVLAATGMSNAIKHLAGIEKIHLSAQRSGDGYLVRGNLPWVSNVGPDHLIAVAAAVEGEGYLMFALRGDTEDLSLHPCPAFSGMEGSSTLNLRFRDVYVGANDVLAHPAQFASYIARIKPGFVLGQVGMGMGVAQGALQTIRESNVTHAHVNAFLDGQEGELTAHLTSLQSRVKVLAQQASAGDTPLLPVLKLRAEASELALQAATSAVLHAGARGYLMRHSAQRRLREAAFVSIVTPALKHLRFEIASLERAQLGQIQQQQFTATVPQQVAPNHQAVA